MLLLPPAVFGCLEVLCKVLVVGHGHKRNKLICALAQQRLHPTFDLKVGGCLRDCGEGGAALSAMKGLGGANAEKHAAGRDGHLPDAVVCPTHAGAPAGLPRDAQVAVRPRLPVDSGVGGQAAACAPLVYDFTDTRTDGSDGRGVRRRNRNNVVRGGHVAGKPDRRQRPTLAKRRARRDAASTANNLRAGGNHLVCIDDAEGGAERHNCAWADYCMVSVRPVLRRWVEFAPPTAIVCEDRRDLPVCGPLTELDYVLTTAIKAFIVFVVTRITTSVMLPRQHLSRIASVAVEGGVFADEVDDSQYQQQFIAQFYGGPSPRIRHRPRHYDRRHVTMHHVIASASAFPLVYRQHRSPLDLMARLGPL